MQPEAQPGFAKREGLEPKVVFFAQQVSNSDPVLNKPMQLKCIAEGTWVKSPQPLGNFCNFAAKIVILTPFQSHFARFYVI